jgi:UDP-glucose:glycoprotein glucosyltransferase
MHMNEYTHTYTHFLFFRYCQYFSYSSSFYRFVLEPEIHFTSDGRQTSGPMARFANMPTSPLLTQNMQVPENWLVESVRSPYDLDNIRLEDVDSTVHR